MVAYSRHRGAQFMSASMAVVAPEKAEKAIKHLQACFFPEKKFDDLLYLKKTKQMFEKLRNVDIRVTAG